MEKIIWKNTVIYKMNHLKKDNNDRMLMINEMKVIARIGQIGNNYSWFPLFYFKYS